MQEQKHKKRHERGSSGREERTTVKWSPIKGVQMLELNKMHMFHLIRAQFSAAMKSKFGEIADFIDGGQVYQPRLVVEDYAAMGIKPEVALHLESKAAEQYLADVRNTKREYAKLFGDIESICDTNLKLRLQRMDVYIIAKQSNDSPALWNAIMSLVGDDGTDLDPAERKFRAESKFYAERMSQTEALNIYYDRFKMRFQQCKSLGIIGLQDESDIVRHFYAKLDASRYNQFYREKMNLVSRGIDKWPTNLQSAFSEVERWIPPRATDWTNSRPTAFAIASSSGSSGTKDEFPCYHCGKLGH